MTRCAVVGLGVLGGATLLALARAGVDCVGFEAGRVGHPHGASAGGETRIFRTAVRDGPEYRRLLDRSREAWTELDRSWAAPDRPLLRPSGALTVGPGDDPRVGAVAVPGRTAVLGPDAVAERWPVLALHPGDVAVLDAAGGVLDAVAATRALTAEAARLGATVHEDTRVHGIGTVRGRSWLHTAAGEFGVDTVVVATGRHRVPAGPGPAHLGVEHRRVVLSWFPTGDAARFAPGALPPGLSLGDAPFSFVPSPDGRTVKVNLQVPQPRVTEPDGDHPHVPDGYPSSWAGQLSARLSGLRPAAVRTESYVEGYTPDRRGIVAPSGTGPRIVTLAGFSGQGFKYAPAVGEIAAGLVRGAAAPATFAATTATVVG